ncbi:hypothetical protein CBM2592_B110032 [Cupriavidus taiwanensis]|nr:hypothetical protein CBM2588_B140026 [Cupriavidus taiwanensis]SOY63491.1 hypothetical protein CBM2592_B110032 [Cupriavidus taiwanensis]SOY93698.1 hypothetical protein CBM2591_B100005 [Cupriavidus taiwanensis]SOZ26953.1 hypothetical protein CBM2608_B100026 [Cupriavidus taiwanensis]SOZ85357.1 hypothetical protein CBM2618_B130118 [Cupriavidus taiwanensis]
MYRAPVANRFATRTPPRRIAWPHARAVNHCVRSLWGDTGDMFVPQAKRRRLRLASAADPAQWHPLPTKVRSETPNPHRRWHPTRKPNAIQGP